MRSAAPDARATMSATSSAPKNAVERRDAAPPRATAAMLRRRLDARAPGTPRAEEVLQQVAVVAGDLDARGWRRRARSARISDSAWPRACAANVVGERREVERSREKIALRRLERRSSCTRRHCAQTRTASGKRGSGAVEVAPDAGRRWRAAAPEVERKARARRPRSRRHARQRRSTGEAPSPRSRRSARSAQRRTSRGRRPATRRAVPVDGRAPARVVEPRRGCQPSRARAPGRVEREEVRLVRARGPGSASQRPVAGQRSAISARRAVATGTRVLVARAEVPRPRRARGRRRTAARRARGSRASGSSTCCHGASRPGCARDGLAARAARARVGHQPVLAPSRRRRSRCRPARWPTHAVRRRRRTSAVRAATSSAARLAGAVGIVAAQRLVLAIGRPRTRGSRSTCRWSRSTTARTPRARGARPRAALTVPMHVGRERLDAARGRSAAPAAARRGGTRSRAALRRAPPRSASASRTSPSDVRHAARQRARAAKQRRLGGGVSAKPVTSAPSAEQPQAQPAALEAGVAGDEHAAGRARSHA